MQFARDASESSIQLQVLVAANLTSRLGTPTQVLVTSALQVAVILPDTLE